MQETQSKAALPVWGAATLAAAAVGTTLILIGIPWIFGRLLTSPGFAALPMPAIETLFTLVTFGLLALLAFAGLRLGKVPVPLGARPGVFAGAGLAIGVLGFTISLALCVIAGTAQEGMPAAEGMGLFLLETALTVIQSGAEELTFRGWLQGDLRRRWGRWPALGAAAVLFAVLHFVAAAQEPLTFVTMLLGGLLFGLVYEKSGSLLLPWALHFGWNWTEELVFGLAPENPGTGTFGALLNIDTRGSPWWGGTQEGLNASLSSVIVLLALVAATLAWPDRSEAAAAEGFRKTPARG